MERERDFRPGDMIRCEYPDAFPLTKGKIYKIIAVKSGWLQIEDDREAICLYAEVRFTKVSSPEQVPSDGSSKSAA